MDLRTNAGLKRFIGCLMLAASGFLFLADKPVSDNHAAAGMFRMAFFSRLYDSLSLGSLGLTREAYGEAMQGFDRLQTSGMIRNQRVVSIIDFSLPSFAKRLFVIDLVSGKLLFNTFVAHGRNSGDAFATSFSNRPNSMQSSLGFYITGDTYRGHHGYSLRLQGMEPGINDQAFNRGIVMHAARYVSDAQARRYGYIGRSEGCPAIPAALHRAVIEKIKDGSCLFIYSPDKTYSLQSGFLQPAA